MGGDTMPSWSEKELEDWLCCEDRLKVVFEESGVAFDDNALLFRQVSCPVGIMDLVLTGRDQVVVIELKAEQAGHKALFQLLRYTGYVRWRHHRLARTLDGGRCRYANDSWSSEKYATQGVIIAPSFDDDLLWAVDEIPMVQLVQVRQRFSLESADLSLHSTDANRAYREQCMDDQFDLAWTAGVEQFVKAELADNGRTGR